LVARSLNEPHAAFGRSAIHSDVLAADISKTKAMFARLRAPIDPAISAATATNIEHILDDFGQTALAPAKFKMNGVLF